MSEGGMMRRKALLMMAFETVGVGIAAVGVAMWSVPAAFVAVGAVIVAACEVRGG